MILTRCGEKEGMLFQCTVGKIGISLVNSTLQYSTAFLQNLSGDQFASVVKKWIMISQPCHCISWCKSIVQDLKKVEVFVVVNFSQLSYWPGCVQFFWLHLTMYKSLKELGHFFFSLVSPTHKRSCPRQHHQPDPHFERLPTLPHKVFQGQSVQNYLPYHIKCFKVKVCRTICLTT